MDGSSYVGSSDLWPDGGLLRRVGSRHGLRRLHLLRWRRHGIDRNSGLLRGGRAPGRGHRPGIVHLGVHGSKPSWAYAATWTGRRRARRPAPFQKPQAYCSTRRSDCGIWLACETAETDACPSTWLVPTLLFSAPRPTPLLPDFPPSLFPLH